MPEDNEERISAAERQAEEERRETARVAGYEIALEGATQRYRGYRQGIYDAMFFTAFLAASAVLVYVSCWKGGDR